MADLEKTLKESIALYRQMVDAFDELDGLLQEGRPEGFDAFVEDLSGRQAHIERLDSILAPELHRCLADGRCAGLLAERGRLLERAAEQNRLLSEKIRGILPVIADELSQLRAGRAAVSGYASGADQRGRLVRESF